MAMHRITNLTASPLTLHTADQGKLVLPANGQINGCFDDEYLKRLRAFPAISVERIRRGRPAKESEK